MAKKKLPKVLALLDEDMCTGCEACMTVCPVDCIHLIPGPHHDSHRSIPAKREDRASSNLNRIALSARYNCGMARRKSELLRKRKPKRSLQVFNSMAEADEADRRYWWSRSGAERLRELERLRQLNWGYGKGRPTPR